MALFHLGSTGNDDDDEWTKLVSMNLLSLETVMATGKI
jgi:hypothetical protein